MYVPSLKILTSRLITAISAVLSAITVVRGRNTLTVAAKKP